MSKVLLSLILCFAALADEYKSEPAGPPPGDLAPAIAQSLSKEGTRILGADGQPLAEIWFRSSAPSGPPSAETGVTFPAIPHGALLGVIRYIKQGQDRRGQMLKPGVYTLRFSYYPVDGAHQGVAPQRDFLILSQAATDTDAAATPNYEQLMQMSGKASGTPHPAILSFWKADTDFKPGFEKSGEHDWVLQTKMGDEPVAVILIGVAEG